MTSIREAIQNKLAQGTSALIPYIMAGDPNYETTPKALLALQQAGATVIELGLPFTDPIADGVAIQKATLRSFRNDFSLQTVFDLVRAARREGLTIPLILYTYANLIYNIGYDRFADEAVAAGIQGLLVVDLPPEEAVAFVGSKNPNPLESVFLCSPTTSEKRLRLIDEMSTGFVYYVALSGVTGVRTSLPPELPHKLQSIRNIVTKPLAVGFGISKPEHVKMLAPYADIVVIGSAYVQIFEKHQNDQVGLIEALKSFTQEMVAELAHNNIGGK